MNRLEQARAVVRAHRAVGLGKRKGGRLPRQQKPLAIQADYWKAIQPIVVKTKALIDARIVPYLPHVIRTLDAQRQDAHTPADVSARFAALHEQVAALVRPQETASIAARFAASTNAFQKAQIQRQAIAAIGVDLGALEPNLAGGVSAFVADNVRLIRSIPTKYLSDVESDVTSALRSGERWETLASDIEDRFNVTTRRAQLIARDQVGKFYGEVNEARQQAMGVTRYVWRTVNDERVRDEHEERDGQTFEWDSPPEDGNPGEPVNCRCYGDPVFSDIVDGL